MKDYTNNGYSNRVADAIYLYAEQDAQLMISNPMGGRSSLHDIELKLEYYSDIYNKYRRRPNADEKLSLRYVRHEIAMMKARLNPTILNQILYSNVADSIGSFINGNRQFYKNHNSTIKDIQRDLIQEHNLQALSTSMKKAGFSFQIEGKLKKMIEQDLPQFHIRDYDIHYPKADFVLHFKKFPGTDVYYFEKFDAVSRPSLDSVLSNDPSCRRHTFSLHDKMRFTANEAANLVNGKSVCKNIDGKETWLLLNATSNYRQQPFETISFNLEKAMERLPIKQKENPSQYQSLLQTLKAGNSKEVIFTINGNSVKYIIDAAPSRKMIDVLDKNDRLVDISRLLNGQKSGLTNQVIETIKQLENAVIDLGEAPKSKVSIR